MQKIIGFTAGAFDVCHAGHYIMFKECKEQCDYLIVGLQNNPNIDRPDKNIPVQTIEERRIQLESCKYIDEIIEYNTEKDLYHLLNKLYNENRIDIRFMGIDWKDKPNYSRDLLPKIKVIYNSRNHNYSSSNLRKRIYEAENKRINKPLLLLNS